MAASATPPAPGSARRATGRRRARLAVVASLLPLLMLRPAASASPAPPGDRPPVIVDLYAEAGCPSCERLGQRILPLLAARYPGRHLLRRHDLGDEAVYLRFLECHRRLGSGDNEPVYAVVDDRLMLSGEREIADRLVQIVGDALASPTPGPPTAAPPASPGHPRSAWQASLDSFTWPGVLAAGLIDSLNPCAIATLVFFMSLLAARGTRAPRLLAAGLAFAAGSWLAYLTLGLGLVHAWRALESFRQLRASINTAMAFILILLAILSLRDALRYRRSGRAGDITLQLPRAVKQAIHGRLRHGLGARLLIPSMLAAGVAVTLLESLCTGQIYLPTLALVARASPSPWRALGYLAGYNLMFILPLLAVLALTLAGLRFTRLLHWSRRTVILAKLLAALLFLALAALLLSVKR